MTRPIWTGEEFERRVKAALVLALEGLTTDGAHHKQYYLERIVETLGVSIEKFTEQNGVEWERGIAP